MPIVSPTGPFETSKIASTQQTPRNLEEVFPLAMDTLKKLPQIHHEIDDHGFLIIPQVLKFRDLAERDGEVLLYSTNAYNKNKIFPEKSRNNEKEKLNQMLNNLSIYNPAVFIIQPLSFLDRVDLLRKPGISGLVRLNPNLALSLVTAKDCGFESNNALVRRGALNLISVIAKHTEHSILTSKETTKDLTEQLHSLILTRNIVQKAYEKETEVDLKKVFAEVDKELSNMEAICYEYCKSLPKGTLSAA